MKKNILILTLLLINILFLVQKLLPQQSEKINIKLNENELGILFLNDNTQESLLLELNKKTILYIITYEDESTLIKHINKFKEKIDYVVMNQDYNINIGNKKIITDKITLNDIEFTNNKIKYNTVFCLNEEENCDYVYDIPNKYILVGKNKYKIESNAYTMLKINDTYEITYLK